MGFSAKLTMSVVAQVSNTLDLTSPQADVVKSYVQQFAEGTGANQAHQIFTDTRQLAASASESLDLSGVLAAALGGTIAFTGIKAIILKAKSTNTGALRVGKVVANGFVGPFDQTAGALGIKVELNGLLVLINPSATGWAVTAGTGDLLSIENLVAAVADYDIIVVGETS